MSPRRFHLLLLLAVSLPARAASLGEPLPEERQLLSRMATQGTNTATLFALADLCHDAGVEGDEKAVLRGEAYLRQLLEMEPTNAPALALLGSIYTMKGRDAFWPTTQLRLAREGNKMMDRAVSLAPDDIRTRTIRALNNAHMPEFLGRGDIVRADLAWLWEKVEKEPASFTTSAKQQVALHWGRRLKRMHQEDEARRVWRRGREFAPESEVASEITEEEAKLR